MLSRVVKVTRLGIVFKRGRFIICVKINKILGKTRNSSYLECEIINFWGKENRFLCVEFCTNFIILNQIFLCHGAKWAQLKRKFMCHDFTDFMGTYLKSPNELCTNFVVIKTQFLWNKIIGAPDNNLKMLYQNVNFSHIFLLLTNKFEIFWIKICASKDTKYELCLCWRMLVDQSSQPKTSVRRTQIL